MNNDTFPTAEELGLPDCRDRDDSTGPGFLPAEALSLPDCHDRNDSTAPEAAPVANATTPPYHCPLCGKKEHYAKGRCKKCYQAGWYQDKMAKMPPAPKKKPTGRPPISGMRVTACTACGSKDVHARGFCYTCYKRAFRQGNVTPEKAEAPYLRQRTTDPATGEKKTCSYCGLHPVYAHGLCRSCHTRAKRNGGDPTYKSPSYVRVMKSRRALKALAAKQNNTEPGTGGAL